MFRDKVFIGGQLQQTFPQGSQRGAALHLPSVGYPKQRTFCNIVEHSGTGSAWRIASTYIDQDSFRSFQDNLSLLLKDWTEKLLFPKSSRSGFLPAASFFTILRKPLLRLLGCSWLGPMWPQWLPWKEHSLLEICRSAAWGCIHTFTRHNALFHASVGDACLASAILSSVLQHASLHPHPQWALLDVTHNKYLEELALKKEWKFMQLEFFWDIWSAHGYSWPAFLPLYSGPLWIHGRAGTGSAHE